MLCTVAVPVSANGVTPPSPHIGALVSAKHGIHKRAKTHINVTANPFLFNDLRVIGIIPLKSLPCDGMCLRSCDAPGRGPGLQCFARDVLNCRPGAPPGAAIALRLGRSLALPFFVPLCLRAIHISVAMTPLRPLRGISITEKHRNPARQDPWPPGGALPCRGRCRY